MVTLQKIIIFLLSFLLISCGFHLQGEMRLAPAFHTVYLQIADPYGQLARNLQQSLKLSKVQLVSSPEQANIILTISKDTTSQELLGVSSTQQTRQYNLIATTVFDIANNKGETILGPQTLTESRIMTLQSNQILGSSNEVNLFYQQMQRTLAYAIMNRLASREVTQRVNAAFAITSSTNKKKP